MIAILSGVVEEKLADTVVIGVNGVGYGVFMPAEEQGALKVGDETKLYIHEYIREQAHDLFGFLSRDTKALFEQLLNVNGVGPKMALNMLSIGTAAEVRQALAGGDVKFMQQASGVGKRVAERVVVELKDKVGLTGVDLETSGLLKGEETALKDEAVEALVSLGYTVADAAKALAPIDPELSSEDRVKLALKGAGK